jgi:arylsulfatase A-like enzyme
MDTEQRAAPVLVHVRKHCFPDPPNYRPHNDEPYCDDWARLSDGERAQLPSWRRGYYAQVASIDWNVGRLLAAIDAAGEANDTIVVFTSDHGEMFGAHGRRAKNIFYEEACCVPLLMRWPQHIAAGSRSAACVSTVDLMPTLLALLNVEAPADVEGMNLQHCGRGAAGPEPDAALMQICGATAAWEDGHQWRALRDKQYTYAIYRVDGNELLFDHIADPYQLDNLAHDAAHVEMLARFRAMLQQNWLA